MRTVPRSPAAILLAALAAALAITLATPSATGARPAGAAAAPRTTLQRASSLIDNLGRMNVNNLDLVVTNHGSFGYDLITGNAGLIYPRGTTKTALFAGGIWIAGTVNGEVRDAVAEYSQEFVPGPMANGTFQPDQFSYHNFRFTLASPLTGSDLADYRNQGGPTDDQGNALLFGDATIWSVFNDADPGAHTNEAGSTEPLGVEVQQTVFAYNRAGALGNVIYFKWKLTNKGANMIQDAYVSVWSDPDLGGASDDIVGCDTTLSLGYCYNATNSDLLYGSMPPAVGFTLLRGPIVSGGAGVADTLGMTAFLQYVNGTDPATSIETYNYLRGLDRFGSPIHLFGDPGMPVTTYMFSGNPTTNTGWIDTTPYDVRMHLSSGPFTMAPGESQEILAALIVGQGTDRLSSVSDLEAKTQFIKNIAWHQDHPPTITAPAAVSGVVGAPIDFTVTSQDPGGTAIFFVSGLPYGATFDDQGDGSALFHWTPEAWQAGAYTVTFTAYDAGASASASTVITVTNPNHAPVADAGGPYSGYAGSPVEFDGTGSSDPDGDPLTFAWRFGDGGTASGATPAHTYSAPGRYAATLTVSDGQLYVGATVFVDVVDRLVAITYAWPSNRVIRLRTEKPEWCVLVQPADGSFDLATVDPSSLVLSSPGTGTVESIHAVSGKIATVSDRNRDGVDELTVCFAKSDLRALFADVTQNQDLPASLTGSLTTGGGFQAALEVTIVVSGGPLAASFAPNPVARGGGTLEFVTERSGRARVSLFDLSGRLVRRVWEATAAEAGLHRVRVEARSDAGRPLASGVYFYRIETAEGSASGRVMVLR